MSEIARLRKALKSIAEIIRNNGYGTELAWTRIGNILTQSLSSNTEEETHDTNN